MKKLHFFFILLCISVSLHAQRGWELGGWAGVSNYFGDLNTNFNVSNPHLAGGLMARYNFNERLAFRFSANYGSVNADDAESKNSFEQARNLHFKSVIGDATAQFEFNFLSFIHGSNMEFFSPYLFAGLSVFYFNPEARAEDDTWVGLRDLGTEGQFLGEEYYSFAGALAYGIGFKFSIDHKWSINFEIGARKAFTDYLDDVSTVYPDFGDLENLRGDLAVQMSDPSIPIFGVNDGKIGEEGRQRGNSNNNDSYTLIGIGLTYYFGDIRCPSISR